MHQPNVNLDTKDVSRQFNLLHFVAALIQHRNLHVGQLLSRRVR